MSNEESSIRGTFIYAQRIIGDELAEFAMIKLSSINSIEPINQKNQEKKGCFFKTYKDYVYVSIVDYYELVGAINGFIFEPQKHFERYPD